MNNQVIALTEKFNQMMQKLQQQCEVDRRRLNQVERKLEAGAEDRARNGEQRERWAELQGKVDGLIEETQSLTRRVEGLDERLWTRTTGSDGAKQRGRELEQQVQALEQQVRLSAATTEETSKRQAAKLRRAEHAAEEAVRRLARLEEDVRAKVTVQRDGFLETRLGTLEQQQEQLDDLVRSLQAQVDEGLPGFAGLGDDDGEACGPRLSEGGRDVDEVLHAVEKSHSELEKKVMKQVEEQAAFRVKVDHQLSRVNTLADRLETAHEPAMEALRSELASQRSQDRQLADGEVSALRRRIDESADGTEDALAEVREGLRELRAHQGSMLGPRHEEDAGVLRGLSDRLADLEQRAESLEEHVSLGPGGGVDDGDDCAAEGAVGAEDLEDLRSRLDWLEEQSAARAAERPDARHAADAQDKMCKVLERLSCLEQQASRGEVDKLHQHLQQLQDVVERRHAEDSSSTRSTAEAEAKVGAVSQQVALLAARLSEVEGSLDFAREAGEGASRVMDVSGVSEAGSGRPPLPRGEVERDRSNSPPAAATVEIQDKLVHVAEHLEAERSEILELSRRLEAVERQLAEGEPTGSRGQGSGAEAKVQVELEALSKRLRGLEEGAEPKGGLEALSERLLALEEGAEPEAKLEALSEQLGALKGDLAALSKRQGALEEGAEPKGELEALSERLGTLEEGGVTRGELDALSKRLLLLEGVESSEDLNKLRGELSQLAKQVQELQGQRFNSPVVSNEPSSYELRGDLQQLEEKFDSTVGTVKEDASEAKAAAAELSGKVSDLQEDVKKLAGQPWKEALDGQQKTLEDIQNKLGGLETNKATLSALHDSLQEHKKETEAMRGRVEVMEKQVTPTMIDELKGAGNELKANVESASVEVKGELESLCKRLDDLEMATGPPKAAESAEREAQDRQAALEELARGSRAAVSEAEAKLAARIQAVEEQLASRSAGIGGGDASGDSKARVDVQEKVSDLTAQLAKELKDLARHKEELQDVASAAIQKASPDPSDETLRPQAALDSLAKEVAESGKRARAAEDALHELRLELNQMRGASPKVGISVGGGADDLRDRMDLLDKQVGEIRLQLKGKVSPLGHARGRSPAGEEPLDFSLTGASEQMRGNANLGEEPLDFSLTGMSDRPANLGESLNFSLTEASKKDALAPEPKPVGATAENADSGGGARGVGLGGAAGSAASGCGARSKPSPLKLDAEEKAVPLSPVQEGSISDDRRKASGSKDADRPQESWGRLAAGALVAGQQSAASPSATRRSPSATSPASAGPAAASPAKSPASDQLAASLQSHLGESMVSQSGNEASICADYSVEDSTELEKCDYFEAVEASSPRESPAASPSGPGDALDSILGGRPRPAELKPAGLTPVSAEAPMSAASTGTVIRHSPEGAGAPTGGAASSPTARDAGQDAGADDYADESFDEEMSIPESIPSGNSGEGSGSDDEV